MPLARRRGEIIAFRQNPACRLFLSTDSGGVGLNLQNASVVINCDLPWNPAKLEQRIARAWRKNQLRPVTVINLIAEKTIEQGMLGSLANKTELARGVLDGVGELSTVKFRRGRQELIKQLEQVLSVSSGSGLPAASVQPMPTADPAAAFAGLARLKLGTRLLRCEETWLAGSESPVLVALVQGAPAEHKPLLENLLKDTPWRGPRPVLQVLDLPTWESLQSLSTAGLVQLQIRSSRALLVDSVPTAQAALSQEQSAQVTAGRIVIQRKVRAVRALLAADLAEEAVDLLRDAMMAYSKVAALSLNQAAPVRFEDLIVSSLGSAWPDTIRESVKALGEGKITNKAAFSLMEWLL